MKYAVLGLVGVLVYPAVAHAQDGFKDPEVTQRRGVTTLVFRGRLDKALVGKAALARLRRGKHTDLGARVDVAANGEAQVVIRTARLLLEDRYELEVLGGDGNVLAGPYPFRVGSEQDATQAQARLKDWYRNGASTLRELTASLERRGAFHATLARAGDAKGELRRFEELFLPEWDKGRRRARMDVATWQRRLVLPWLVEQGEDMLKLLELLNKRRKVWVACLERGGRNQPGAAEDIQTVARRLLKRLDARDLEARLKRWGPGELARPPALPQADSTFTGAVGFKVRIPKGARVQAATNPIDRVTFVIENVTVKVRVRDLWDDTKAEQLVRRLEVGAWEGQGWDSYKRLSSKTLEGGHRLEFEARLPAGKDRRVTANIIQLSRFPTGNRRVYSLLILRAANVPWPSALDGLEDSFEVTR